MKQNYLENLPALSSTDADYQTPSSYPETKEKQAAKVLGIGALALPCSQAQTIELHARNDIFTQDGYFKHESNNRLSTSHK